MDKKIKIFLLVLIALSLISSVVAFSLFISNQAVQERNKTLTEENAKAKEEIEKISKKAQTLAQDNKAKQEQVDKLTQEINAIVVQRDELQGKFEAMRKELEDANQRVSSIQTQTSSAASQEQSFEQISQDRTSNQADETYWAGILKAKSALEIQLKALKEKLDENMIKLNEAEKGKSELDLEVNRLNAEKDDIIRELNYNKKLVDNISLELLREKKDKRTLGDQFSTLKEENFVLSNQLKQTLAAKISLEKKLNDIENKKENLDLKMSQVNSVLQERISELRDIKKEIESTSINSSAINSMIELPAIVVKSESGKDSDEDSSSRGSVVSVDRKNNFVIVNIGQDQGIEIGKSFKVYRNSAEIGKVEVIKVRKDISACDIKQERTAIDVGDEVR
jgi:chromosome segregation ATPase